MISLKKGTLISDRISSTIPKSEVTNKFEIFDIGDFKFVDNCVKPYQPYPILSE